MKIKQHLKFASVLIAVIAAQVALGYAFPHHGAAAAIVPLVGTFNLKELRKKVKDAKDAWTSARKAKKDQKELDELKAEHNRLQEFVDNAEAEEKKDEDTIEIKAMDNEMSRSEVEQAIAEAVAKGLKAELPEQLKTFATAANVKDIVAAELKKVSGDSQTVKKTDIQAILDASTQAAAQKAMEGFRREKKQTSDPADADQSGHSHIERPVSWRKGNLPLHGQQMLNVLMRRQMNEGIDQKMIEKGEALGESILHSYCAHAKMLEQHRGTPGMKALTSTGAATGDELVPSDLSSQLQRRMFLASNLVAVFASREIQMPTDPYKLPLSTTRPQFYGESTENTAATASTPGTGAPTLTSVRMVGEVDYSYELDEDSIIPVLPWLQQLLAEAGADAWEDALINGDTTGTHQDTDTAAGSAKLPAKFVKGFRKLALAQTTLKTDLSSGGFSNANMLAVRKLLKKYGGDPRNLIWLSSPTSAITLQGLTEVATMEKFGNRATIITGEIAALQGIPIIQSERVREDVDATGVNGASGNTKTTITCVNINRFLTGRRRDFMLETFRNIQSGTNNLVASFRKAFVPIEDPSSTVTSVAVGYNLAA